MQWLRDGDAAATEPFLFLAVSAAVAAMLGPIRERRSAVALVRELPDELCVVATVRPPDGIRSWV
jgi:hypothetical protein